MTKSESLPSRFPVRLSVPREPINAVSRVPFRIDDLRASFLPPVDSCCFSCRIAPFLIIDCTMDSYDAENREFAANPAMEEISS